MPRSDPETFLKRLRVTFRVEADEHLRAISALLRELEQPVGRERAAQAVETLFREAHSLKGAARAVNLSDVEGVCADLETRLAQLKRANVAPDPAQLETLALRADELARLLAAELGGAAAPGDPAPPVAVSAPLPPDRSGQTVRIATARLAALLVQAEELAAFRFDAGQLRDELGAICGELSQWQKAASRTARDARGLRRARATRGRRAATEGRQPVDALLDALERDELFVKSLGDRIERARSLAEQERRTLGGIADQLQDGVRQVLMQPFGALLELLPKLVRELARDSDKDAELRLDGDAIEIDRRILEQMKDPLIHLVRNAVDHGIEPPAERVRRGKPARGRVRVAVEAKEGNRVELAIEDDGAGIDVERVTASALEAGVVAADAARTLSRDERLGLIYESGLSTSRILTDISGRGLGLAIVREKIDRLGGTIAVETAPGAGTTFRIVLPTSLANFHGLLVAVGEREFVLPVRNVERVARIPRDAVGTAGNRETIALDAEALSLVRLADVLGVQAAAGEASGPLAVVIVAGGGRRLAFAVDAVLGDREVLVKGLGPQLRRVRNIAGATVLGAGRLVPILSVPDLMTSALRAPPGAPAATPPARPAGKRQSLLVVEDSITSRSLLKNILESAGYDVATAVDGIDALTALRTADFDLVVSDVEMPRMDGFALTARIREDRELADLPVVLVTALGSHEHRERGIDAGANAYVVKSSFDQSNLLEVIRRLT